MDNYEPFAPFWDLKRKRDPYDTTDQSVSDLADIESPDTHSADVVNQKASGVDPLTIRPTPPSESPLRSLYEKTAEYYSRRPDEAQYKPSLGRKILGTVVGALASRGNPERAARISQSIGYSKYNKAMQDWQEEGQGLKAVEPIAHQISQEEIDKYKEQGADVRSRRTAATAEHRTGVTEANHAADLAFDEKNLAARQTEGAANRASAVGIAKLHEAGATSRTQMRIDAKNKENALYSKTEHLNRGEAEQIETDALEEAVRQNNDWEGFISRNQNKVAVGPQPPQAKGTYLFGLLGSDKVPTEKLDDYNKFLDTYNAAVDRMTKATRPGSRKIPDVNPIQEEPSDY